MATGMVLIIVSRNIDLSVGSLLGFLGYAMALVQTDGILAFFGISFDRRRSDDKAVRLDHRPRLRPAARRARRRCCRASSSPTAACPSFIVTLGRLPRLARRSSSASAASRARRSPRSTTTFQLLGGGAKGSLGEWKSWLLALSRVRGHRAQHRARPPAPAAPRASACGPMWVEIGARASSAARRCIAGSRAGRQQVRLARSPARPTGIAYPVVILIGVTLLMSYLARRRRFGRYVYAYGGNPEAAELGGINTRRTVMLTFVAHGRAGRV